LAKSYIDSGKLVPDDVTVDIVGSRLKDEDCKNGFIMDGFPRTIPQAQLFDKMLDERQTAVDAVINITVDDDVIIKRLSGRRMCSCGKIYHVENNPPRTEGICDVCGSKLYIRDDDKEETIKERLRTYHAQTSPLVDYYQKKGLLLNFDGTKSKEETTREIMDSLKKITKRV
jgi:adenylate kinase